MRNWPAGVKSDQAGATGWKSSCKWRATERGAQVKAIAIRSAEYLTRKGWNDSTMLARIVMLFSMTFFLIHSGPVFSVDRTVVIKAAASVIRVAAAFPDRSASLGSGVALSDGRVVTNCHVTRGAQSLTVIDADLRLYAESNDSDFAADLCILATGPLAAPHALLGSSRSLKVGDEVVAIGFSGGHSKSMSPGRITALFPYRGGYVMRTTAAFRPGASGGGLFDEHGRLVGIITFFRQGKDEYAFFAIPVEWIETLQYSAVSETPDAIPFWMREHDEQPRFLQGSTLEADKDWQGLARLARAWGRYEPLAAEAWDILVRALRETGEPMDTAASVHPVLSVPRSFVWSNFP